MVKKRKRTSKKDNPSNTIVVKSASSGAGWLRIVSWIVIILVFASVITPLILMLGGWVGDVKKWFGTITGQTQIDPANDDETSAGQTSESRVLKAYALIADLNPEEDIPSNFDQRLLTSLEIDAYTRLLVHQNKNGQKTFSLMVKAYEDYSCEDPLFIYSYGISKNITGINLSKIPLWLWLTEGVAITAAIVAAPFTAGTSIAFWVASVAGAGGMISAALKYDTVAETTWISQNGETWSAINSYDWQSKPLYMKNKKGEVVRYKFKTDMKPASIIFDYWDQVNSFANSNVERFEPNDNSNVRHALSVEGLNINGQWIARGDAGMTLEYININKDDFKSNNPLSVSRFYEIFKIITKETKYETLNDGISLKILSWEKSNEMTLEEFVSLEKLGFARFIEYKFNNNLMNGPYCGYAFNKYETVTSLALSSRLKSKFFSATYKVIKKGEFAGTNTATNARFITEFIPGIGIRIVTLPFELSFSEGLTVGQYQFQITQKDNFGQILTTQTTQINIFDETKVFDDDASAFLIPLDENFVLESGVKNVELNIINTIGLTGYEEANSRVEVA